MSQGNWGQMAEVRVPKDRRSRRSGSVSQGSWITPPPESDKPLMKRAWFIVCAALLAVIVVLILVVLAV